MLAVDAWTIGGTLATVVLGIASLVATFYVALLEGRKRRLRAAQDLIARDLAASLVEGHLPSRDVLLAIVRSALRAGNASQPADPVLDLVLDDLLRQVTSDVFIADNDRKSLQEELLDRLQGRVSSSNTISYSSIRTLRPDRDWFWMIVGLGTAIIGAVSAIFTLSPLRTSISSQPLNPILLATVALGVLAIGFSFLYQRYSGTTRIALSIIVALPLLFLPVLIYETTNIARRNLQRTLSPQDLHGISLAHRDLSGLQLVAKNLASANLQGANFRDTNLRDATLDYAILTDADLSGSQLFNSSLRAADLRRTKLIGADLRTADLTSANLADSEIKDATLIGAVADSTTIWPRGFNPQAAGVKLQS